MASSNSCTAFTIRGCSRHSSRRSSARALPIVWGSTHATAITANHKNFIGGPRCYVDDKETPPYGCLHLGPPKVPQGIRSRCRRAFCHKLVTELGTIGLLRASAAGEPSARNGVVDLSYGPA